MLIIVGVHIEIRDIVTWSAGKYPMSPASSKY
jgi:hypothetical protein